MWLNITYSQVPSPGVVWTWVSVVWVLLHLSVCLCSVWLSCAHICCQQGLASGADVPHCGAHLPGDCAPSALPVHPACFHGQGSLQGLLLIPWQHDQGGIVLAPLWHSWAQLGLLLCSFCCFTLYLWLSWREITAVVQGEAVNTVLNIQTVLWGWEVKAWHSISSWPLYFTLLLQYINCNRV